MFKIISVIAILIAVCGAQYSPYSPYRAPLLAAPVAAAPVLAAPYAAPVLVDERPEPYSFAYDTADEYGTKLSRQESADGSGAVKGSYGYVDAAGVQRTVEYIADVGGFRATINTNEPGTETSNPAAALYNANPIKVAYTAPLKVAAAAPVLAAPAPYGRFY